MSQEALAAQSNNSSLEINILIGHLFPPPVEESPSNALVPFLQQVSPPTSPGQCQSSVVKVNDSLEICKRKYFQVLGQQYELKSIGGIFPIKFLSKEDLRKGLKEAENQVMEVWSSLTLEQQMDDDDWKQDKKRLRKFIAEINSAVQVKNESNRNLYGEQVVNKRRREFVELFEIKYPLLCSTPPESLESAKENDSFQKFYDHENLKKFVSCMVSQLVKLCEQFTVKLNPLNEEGLKSDAKLAELKEEVQIWGNNLVGKNHKFMSDIQEFVDTSIISEFESQSKKKIKEMLVAEKRPSDFKSTKEKIRNIFKEYMDPYLVLIDQIYTENAMDNCQQFLEQSNQFLEQKMTEMLADAFGKWKKNCRDLSNSHHERMKKKICTTSQSTPQFVLDIYSKHLEKAVELANMEVEENILGTQDEEPSTSTSMNNEELNGGAIMEASSSTLTPNSTPQRPKASVSDGRKSKNGHHSSPTASTSSAANCYNDGHNGDDGHSHKRRKS